MSIRQISCLLATIVVKEEEAIFLFSNYCSDIADSHTTLENVSIMTENLKKKNYMERITQR